MVKVNAFSLFESVVAIAIITCCIGLGSVIYNNVVTAEEPVLVLDGKAEIARLFEDLKKNRQLGSNSFNFEDFRIDQEVNHYKGHPELYQVDYKLYTGKKMQVHQHYLLYHHD